MTDIQDSPAWSDLHGFLQSPYHLSFGIYVDWFNPFTNKTAGKLMVSVVFLYINSSNQQEKKSPVVQFFSTA